MAEVIELLKSGYDPRLYHTEGYRTDAAGRYVREEKYLALLERHDKYKVALDVISRYRCEEFDHQAVAKAALAEEVDDAQA